MAIKNIYEIFDEFKKATTKAERLEVLRKNDCWALQQVLLGTFHPDVQFLISELPDFKREEIPAGMSYSHMTDALSRIYLFVKDNPKAPAELTDKRRLEILRQVLESLEEKEADVFLNILKKDQKIPYLTLGLVNEAFDNIIPTKA